MQLVHNPWEDTLGRAAMLTGLSEEELETIRAANVRGGAAVLTDLQGTNKPAGLNGWYDTVAGYGGGFLYANEVFETLRNEASATISTGESLRLSQQNVEVPQIYTAPVRPRLPEGRLETGPLRKLHQVQPRAFVQHKTGSSSTSRRAPTRVP